MFPETRLALILIPAIVFAGIIIAIVRYRSKPLDNEFDQTVFNFKLSIFYMMFIYSVLYCCLPTSLFFYYPDDIGDIENKTTLLKIIQGNNQAIQRTTEVVSSALFITVMWVASSLYLLVTNYLKSKVIKNVESEQVV